MTVPISPAATNFVKPEGNVMNQTHTSFGRFTYDRNLNRSVNFNKMRVSSNKNKADHRSYKSMLSEAKYNPNMRFHANRSNLLDHARTISYSGIYQNTSRPQGGAPCQKDAYGLPATLKSLKLLQKLNMPPHEKSNFL